MELRMKRIYFNMIKSQKKNLEARLNYPFLRKAKVGDRIVFFWENEKFVGKIIAIRHYNSFNEMMDGEDVNLLLPGYSKSKALEEYLKIYPERKVKENKGILVFAFDKTRD